MAAFLSTGELHAPFIIFFRSAELTTDDEVLDRLQLRGYRGTELHEQVTGEPWVIIGELNDYTIVADDWSYTLWHAERIGGVVTEFALNTSELFCYRLPDVDHTFDFDHFRNGKLERSYHLDPDGWTNPPILTTTGTPLPFETEDLAAEDSMDRPRKVASRLGFDLNGVDCAFRRYAGQPRPELL